MFEFILYSILYKKNLLSINRVIACSLKSELHSKGAMINTATSLQRNLPDLRSELLKFL